MFSEFIWVTYGKQFLTSPEIHWANVLWKMIEIVVKFLLNMIFGEEKRAKIRHFGPKIVSYVMNSAPLVQIGIPWNAEFMYI